MPRLKRERLDLAPFRAIALGSSGPVREAIQTLCNEIEHLRYKKKRSPLGGDARWPNLHPSGDHKSCGYCTTTILRKVDHTDDLWSQKKFCSGVCYQKGNAVPADVRFWRRVSKDPGHGPNGDCWVWTGWVDREGYGKFMRSERSSTGAHRFAYEDTYGVIPDGYFVCHRCDTPACVRPDHLFLGTNQENVSDMVAKKRHRFGETFTRSKLTDTAVMDIRSSKASAAVLADRYGVSKTTILQVRSGRTWRHVD